MTVELNTTHIDSNASTTELAVGTSAATLTFRTALLRAADWTGAVWIGGGTSLGTIQLDGSVCLKKCIQLTTTLNA